MDNSQLEEVVSYLEQGDAADYQAGVLLLQRHCRNRALVAQLLKKDSPGNREKLQYELVKVGCGGRLDDIGEVMNHFAQAVQSAVVPVADALSQVADFAEQPAPDAVPAELQAKVDKLTEHMSQLYNKRCQLSTSLADLDPAEAPRVVAEILALQQDYNAVALQRRALSENPAAEEAAPDAAPAAAAPDRAELLQRRANLRSNISKAKGKLAAAQTEAKQVELREKVAKLEVELQTVDAQLALPQA